MCVFDFTLFNRISTASARVALVVVSSALLMSALPGCATKPTSTVAKNQRVSHVVVHKAAHRLALYNGNTLLREYRVNLGNTPRGHKMQEGDERTPEGEYILDWRNPRSRYYKSIHVSYPNSRDRQFARAIGVDPGGMIMIHGRPNGLKSPGLIKDYDELDWTDGCIAVSNAAMDHIWHTVPDGTPIRILP